jgi:hypothetical protein
MLKVYNKTEIAAPEGANTQDIINALVNSTKQAFEQVKNHSTDMINTTGDPIKDAILVGKFIQENVHYKADGYQEQNIKYPGRLLRDQIGDCKSFSLLAAAILNDLGYTVGFRFASYRKNKIPTHVYNFVIDNTGKKFIFDTCVKNLKESKRHTYIKDMQVNYLSGIDTEIDTLDMYSINGKAKRRARRARRKEEGKGFFKGVKKISLAPVRNAFLGLLRLNARGLATKLMKAIGKDESKTKKFWEKLGGNFSKLKSAAQKGSTKKPLLGAKADKKGSINGANQVVYYDHMGEAHIGSLAAVGTFLAAAAPALVAASKLFKDLKVPDDGEPVADDDMEGLDPTGEGFEAADPEPGSGGITSFKPSPLLIGGAIAAAAAIYFLTKKKK